MKRPSVESGTDKVHADVMRRPSIPMPSLCGGSALAEAGKEEFEDGRMNRPHELDAGGDAQRPAHPGAHRLELRETGDHVLAGRAFLDQLDPAAVARHVPQAEIG